MTTPLQAAFWDDQPQVVEPPARKPTTRKPKWTPAPGYPLPDNNGHTTDASHCPNCGSPNVTLLPAILSGQRIAICQNCKANYIVEPKYRRA